MNEELDNPPAFPRIAHGQDSGMSLRDYFAGQALMGTCANPYICSDKSVSPEDYRTSFAKAAYAQADEMLKQRKETV